MPYVLWFLAGTLWSAFLVVGTAFGGFRLLARDRSERKASGEDAPLPAPAALSAQQQEMLARMQRAVGPESHFITYPNDCVMGVIDSPEQAAQAGEALRAAGISHEDITTFRGHRGAMTIDSTGRYHGVLARLVRVLEAASMDEDHASRYEREADAGHIVLAVHLPHERHRGDVERIFRDHGGHFVNWYGRLHFEPVIP